MIYPVSKEALSIHDKLICEEEIALACKEVGAFSAHTCEVKRIETAQNKTAFNDMEPSLIIQLCYLQARSHAMCIQFDSARQSCRLLLKILNRFLQLSNIFIECQLVIIL
jgi:hypothetical protein